MVEIIASSSVLPEYNNIIHYTGKVLVVDDDEFICHVAKIMLERIGFKVLIARNGCEAVKLFQKYHEDITVVLLDITMPEMNGTDAFLELRRIRHDVKVILSTGYYNDSSNFIKEDEYMAFLEKPYQMEELTDVLQKLIYR
ncbi:MAG: response regulator [Candidatus Eremiobacterota bacterium]